MRRSSIVENNDLAITERWSLKQVFQIYAQIYAHFFEKTPFSIIFYNFLNIRKPLYIKDFQTICANVAMYRFVSEESPIDYEETFKILCKSVICREFFFSRALIRC